MRGTGVVEIRKLVEKEWSTSVIENVIFVPTFRKNLFSVGASVKKGLEVNFSENRVLVLKQGEVVAEGAKQKNDIYRLLFVVPRNDDREMIEAHANESICSLKKWHERYGHVNNVTMKKMVVDGLRKGASLESVEKFFCQPCQHGKAHRLPFLKTVERNQWKVGESIHSDVCGPKSVDSLGGAKYFVLFVDDASGYRCVFFTRSKAQVPEKFVEFSKIVETKFECPIKTF